MSVAEQGYPKPNVSRAVEIAINIGLVFLLVLVCVLILRPFIPLVAWGIIIAVACYPLFRKAQVRLSGREGLAALLCTLVMLAPVGELASGMARALHLLLGLAIFGNC